EESGVPASYKAALLAAQDTGTTVTRAFSGRPARGLRNRFIDEAEAQAETILPFPVQNAATRPMRSAAAKRDDAERLSLWSGRAPALAGRLGSADLLRRLVAEAEAVRANMR